MKKPVVFPFLIELVKHPSTIPYFITGIAAYLKVKEYCQKGEYNKAITYIDEILDNKKTLKEGSFQEAAQAMTFTDLYIVRGMAYEVKGEPERGFDECCKAVKYLPISDSKRAVEQVFDSAIRFHSTSAAAYCFRASFSELNGKIEEAIADYAEAIKRNPKYKEAYRSKTKLLLKMKKHEEYIADLTRWIAIESDPIKISALYVDIAIIYLKKDESSDQAILACDKAIEFNKANKFALNLRAHTYYEKSNWVKAISDYTALTDICSPTVKEDTFHLSSAYLYRGNSFYETAQIEMAFADYNKLIDLEPEGYLGYYSRGRVFYKQQQLESAIADLSKTVALKPDYSNAYVLRAIIYSEQKKFNLAVADYNRAIEIKPDNARAYNTRGWCKFEMGNFGQAIADYIRAIMMNKDPLFYYNRGLAYYCNEQYNLALADYKEALSIAPRRDAYEEFVQFVPYTKPTDTTNTREEILQMFKENFNK